MGGLGFYERPSRTLLITLRMENKFETEIEVRWADVDQNVHLRHSAFYDYGTHARIRFFQATGYDSKKMNALHFGPVLFKEECSFLKEVGLEDTLTVNMLKGSVSEEGGRWTIHHELFNQQGQKVAHITVKGAWLHLLERKLTLPPAALAKALHDLPPGEVFVYGGKRNTE